MGALGTLLGPAATLTAFLASAIAGGVLAVGHAWRRRRLGTTIARTARLATAPSGTKVQIDLDAPATRFAYGPALAVGAVAAVMWR
jgi:Flp pilus assembly protein protease CpaA